MKGESRGLMQTSHIRLFPRVLCTAACLPYILHTYAACSCTYICHVLRPRSSGTKAHGGAHEAHVPNTLARGFVPCGDTAISPAPGGAPSAARTVLGNPLLYSRDRSVSASNLSLQRRRWARDAGSELPGMPPQLKLING